MRCEFISDLGRRPQTNSNYTFEKEKEITVLISMYRKNFTTNQLQCNDLLHLSISRIPPLNEKKNNN